MHKDEVDKLLIRFCACIVCYDGGYLSAFYLSGACSHVSFV